MEFRDNGINEKHERIARAILSAIREMDPPMIKRSNAADIREIPLSENLDSLGMVNLIIGVEDALRKEFNQDIPILGRMNAIGMDPFKTSGTLMDYIGNIV